MDDLFERMENQWVEAGGGSGSGVCWTSLDGDLGVLRFADEAPPTASTAVVAYEGTEHRVPIREGWFFFAVWDRPFADHPRLLRFE